MSDLRNEISNTVLGSTKRNYIIEAGTGVGKTKITLDKLSALHQRDKKILIVVPRLVLISNWKDEINKWQYSYLLNDIVFATYVGLVKISGNCEAVVYDEAHHLSERCRDYLSQGSLVSQYNIYLSATLSKDIRNWVYSRHGSNNIEYVRISTQRAIKSEILPDPNIILIPLQLDDTVSNQLLYGKREWRKFNNIEIVPYNARWKAKARKKPYAVRCTELQYYNEISRVIDWLHDRQANQAMMQVYLNKCGERLKWLASIKQDFIKKLCHIVILSHQRFIVFCPTIEDSECLGIPPVNSFAGTEYLDKFNSHEINEVSCVGMLDEGVNLNDCRIGIFDMINASQRLQVQRVGRTLRHKNPVIIIPYYMNTREEEIIDKWIPSLGSDNINVIDDIAKIKYSL